MKQSMTRQNFRRISNNVRNFRPNAKNITVMALIALANFGTKSFSFLNNLLTVGSTPFEGLNRGQLRQMSFLFAMYRC
jgi:hypothetical protein